MSMNNPMLLMALALPVALLAPVTSSAATPAPSAGVLTLDRTWELSLPANADAWWVASAGDVDSDGHTDLVIGLEAAQGHRLEIHATSATGIDPMASWQLDVPHDGYTARGVGDTNADGFDDVVVCDPWFGDMVAGEGRCSLYLGTASGLGPSPVWERHGAELTGAIGVFGSEGLGQWIEGGLDFDGDGLGDFVLTSMHELAIGEPGMAVVVLGSSQPGEATEFIVLHADYSDATTMLAYGSGAHAVPDLDGDGRDELAIRAVGDHGFFTSEDPADVGSARAVIYGGRPAGGGAGTTTWRDNSLVPLALVRDDGSTQGGVAVGDFDGNGEPELVLPAIFADESRIEAWPLPGTGRQTEVASWSVQSAGFVTEAKAGTTFATGGLVAADVDGDGTQDLVVSSRDHLNVLLGGAAGLDVVPDAIIAGALHSWGRGLTANLVRDEVAHLIGGVGDVDGDGTDDIVALAIEYDDDPKGEHRAEVRIYLGGAPGQCSDLDHDWVCDADDDCPEDFDPGQDDLDDDGIGDACQPDDDDFGTEGDPDDDGQNDDGSSSGAASTSTGSGPGGGSSSSGAPGVGATTEPSMGQPGIGPEVAEGGCGCRQSGGPAGGAVLMVLLGGLLGRRRRTRAVVVAASVGAIAGCNGDVRDLGAVSTSLSGGPGSEGASLDTSDSADGSSGDAPAPARCCGTDPRTVVECDSGEVVDACQGRHTCDPGSVTCRDFCAEAESEEDVVGCEYILTPPTMTDNESPTCLAAILSNPSAVPVAVTVSRAGEALDIRGHIAELIGEQGGLPALTFLDDPVVAPHSVVAVLLAGPGCDTFLGVDPAVDDGYLGTRDQPTVLHPSPLVPHTGIGDGFVIEVSAPVLAYEVDPFLGAESYQTAATVLLPTPRWDENYVVVQAGGPLLLSRNVPEVMYPPFAYRPSVSITARDNDTTVTILPSAEVHPGPGVPRMEAGQVHEVELDAGEFVQIVQEELLDGTVIEADRPISVLSGHECIRLPDEVDACDAMMQTLMPVSALGWEYPAVPVRRAQEPGRWLIMGAVDGTELSWSAGVPGPSSMGRGEVHTVITDEPFVVGSQGNSHPFWLFNMMTGQGALDPAGDDWFDEKPFGDPDWSGMLPPQQYVHDTVFFVDWTYRSTQVVFIRTLGEGSEETPGGFAPVELECADEGIVQGWSALGEDERYEYARVDFGEDPYSECAGGVHALRSTAPFGASVWSYDSYASMSYPAGMKVSRINDVSVNPVP